MTAPKSPSAARRALDYAEKELGVNEVFERATVLRNELDSALTELAEARDKKRSLDADINAREMDIYIDETSKHSDMSVAAMDRHLKKVNHQDPRLVELKSAHLAVVGQIEGLEYDVRMLETDIKIATGRLVELGGYLTYLAAIKTASAANKTSEAGEANS